MRITAKLWTNPDPGELMIRLAFLLVAALFAHGAVAEPVTLIAADGVKVFGELWRARASPAPVVLAFHQASSSHAEYAPLAARLNAAGFTILAIDQRSGGSHFGEPNKTVAAIGRSANYDAALADLAAALNWSRIAANGAPVLLWGSSYSAALVFVLAAQNPGATAAVLAFSPGEYLADGDAVRRAARKVTVPVFITQAADRREIEQSRAIFNAVASADKVLFTPTTGGVHGSSTLRADENPSGAEENWRAVLQFLDRYRPGR
jgi:dienelactone hydrolase